MTINNKNNASNKTLINTDTQSRNNSLTHKYSYNPETGMLDPTYNSVFKMLMSNERNKESTICFLNVIYDGIIVPKIREIHLLPTEIDINDIESKAAIMDFHCIDDKLQEHTIEMQRVRDGDILKRVSIYACNTHGNQIKRKRHGQYYKSDDKITKIDYDRVTTTHSLLISTNKIQNHPNKYFSSDIRVDRFDRNIELYNDIIYTRLDLSLVSDTLDNCRDDRERLGFLIKMVNTMTKEQLDTFVHHNPYAKPLITALNQTSYTSDEMLVLEYAFLKEAAIANEMDELKTRAETAEARADMAEKKARDERILMVKRMLADGITTDIIEKYTGLTKEEILKLR